MGALLLWPPVRLRYGLSGTQPPAKKGTAHTGKLQVPFGRAQQATMDLRQPQLPVRGKAASEVARRFRGAGPRGEEAPESFGLQKALE